MTVRACGMQRGQRLTPTYVVRYCTGLLAPKKSRNCGSSQACGLVVPSLGGSACVPASRGGRQTSQDRMQPGMLDRTQPLAILHRSATIRNPYKPQLARRFSLCSAHTLQHQVWKRNAIRSNPD
jgi:hypothetical protein